MAKKKAQQQPAVKSTDIALPPRPKRLAAKGPGIEIELVTNLFKLSLSLKKEKDIFCHTIQIDLLNESQKSGSSGDAKKPPVQRKIPKDLRRSAVKKAVQLWFKNNQPGTVNENSYVLDSDGSTMYSLFKILDLHDGASKREHSVFTVQVESPRIVDQKSVMSSEEMEVRFFAPTRIDVRAMIDDYCYGKNVMSSTFIQSTLRALNVILTGKIIQDTTYLSMQAKSGSCSVFRYDQKNQFVISPGVICNKGFISSVRATEQGLVANIANSVVPFYQPIKLTDFIANRFRVNNFNNGLPPKVIDDLKRELRLKQVEAIHRNYGTKDRPHYRKYRIHDIGGSTVDEKFQLDDPKTGSKQMVSVFDYFRKEYPECKLSYPKLPCIIDNKRKIPLELCRLVDKQKVNRRLNPIETSNVIREAAMKPERHFQQIQYYANDLGKHDSYRNEFGIEFDRKLIELKGRELPPIRLLGAGKFSLGTRSGAYEARCKFVKSPTIKKWALILLADDNFKKSFSNAQQATSECETFAKRYCDAGMAKGVNVSPLNLKDIIIIQVPYQEPDKTTKTKLRETFVKLNQTGYNHAIFVLPASKDWIYGYMQYLEVDVPRKIKLSGPCTKASCIKDENFVKKILRGELRNVTMFISNLWLKYNTKLGGVNFVLDATQDFKIDKREFNNFLQPGYLFVSIDVCHPAPGDKLEQSVAAAVGMWNITNPNMSTCTRIRVQRKESEKDKSTVEQVGEIGLMFDDILKSYHKQMNGKLPTHIVILRDGVSDGQFHMVLKFELSQIQASIRNLYSNLKVNNPLLSCMTIQKRHRTRFMRKVPEESRKGPDYNIQPGTVVDNTVVEPHSHSFYLAPHKAIQGTARAPHSYVIYDDIKFSQDSAQAMIFALSYLSPRCTKGTSIPTPVNLADLAAERGKHIVVSWNEDNSQMMSADERLAKLNAFLSEMGDATYHNTLYYV